MSELKSRPWAAVATVLALSLLCDGSGVAAEACARTREQTAVYTAELRAQLMVAALSCGSAGRYNAFVTRYQRELSAQGRALRLWFHRQHGNAGDDYLNKFVTRLANEHSQRSANARAPFCAQAAVLFHQLLDEPRLSIVGVLGDPALITHEARAHCEDPTPSANAGAKSHVKTRPPTK